MKIADKQYDELYEYILQALNMLKRFDRFDDVAKAVAAHVATNTAIHYLEFKK
jgi:hypothetical protein